jgi:hypothetical protein
VAHYVKLGGELSYDEIAKHGYNRAFGHTRDNFKRPASAASPAAPT